MRIAFFIAITLLCSCKEVSDSDVLRAELRLVKSEKCPNLFEAVLHVGNQSDDTIQLVNFRNVDIYTFDKEMRVTLPFVFALDDPCLSSALLNSVRAPVPADYLRDSLNSAFFRVCYMESFAKMNEELSQNPRIYDTVAERIWSEGNPLYPASSAIMLLPPQADTAVHLGHLNDIVELTKLYWRADTILHQQHWVHDVMYYEGDTIAYVRPLGFDFSQCFEFKKIRFEYCRSSCNH